MPIRRRGALHRRLPGRRVEVASQTEAAHEPFERLVERALDELPEDVRVLLGNVAVVIEDEPTPAQLHFAGPDADDGLYGLYEGVPTVEYGADQVAFPNKISLFRLPLEEDFPDPAALAAEVRRTVVHELGHHAGIGDRRLHELGYD